MALIQCDFYSETLGLSTSMNVILPQQTVTQIGMDSTAGTGKFPVLYLLHGLSDDHTIWLRRTSIERYAAAYGIAIVMPAVHRSFYTDMKHGYNYWTFVSEELPAIARSFFPLSDRREDNFVAGLSMGGYGAFKLGLRCPDRYAAAASLSGAMDMNHFYTHFKTEFERIFGTKDTFTGSQDDLFALAAQLAKSDAKRPALYQCCGTEDFLYEDNVKFRDYLRQHQIDVTYEEEPGEHEWGYWDMKIKRVLEWLPLARRT
ncbi:S-formylglutathione hydrolase FrmB [Paenibacillus phyllosphaerae]|uniref:S-formylglutathione hydrolase FrmB n=1 Tax=Paenibacillus phyllosphaerae TaxID=274593 RepID=A0A7W5FQI8_9BACL|nr:alpha/beta hydrolase family protein [Paenibacillus phyllosphaerae]MBB3113486.1 S-formylglutathione hydrolase FrmB [Paenibacillus phyllosphaerae]